jgi:hypothetical protein
MKQIEFNLHSSERMKNVLQKKKIINSKRHENQILMMTRSVSDFWAAFCCL